MSPSTVLVPIDGTDPSFRALEFATEFVDQFDAALDVVHITDEHTDATDEILRRADRVLDAAGIDAEAEVSTDLEMEFRPAERVGQDVLELVERRGYDHVIMGHQSAGTVERAIIGSAAETVLRADRVPLTVLP
jgi:nucleotide-binding universal stress UspA family protein